MSVRLRHWLCVGSIPVATVSVLSLFSHPELGITGIGVAGLMFFTSVLLTPTR